MLLTSYHRIHSEQVANQNGNGDKTLVQKLDRNTETRFSDSFKNTVMKKGNNFLTLFDHQNVNCLFSDLIFIFN